jgi:ankyrin repeat protein
MSTPLSKQKNGVTPLHYACHWRRLDVARVILDRGANVETPKILVASNIRHQELVHILPCPWFIVFLSLDSDQGTRLVVRASCSVERWSTVQGAQF